MSDAIQLKVKSVTGRVRYYPIGRLGELVKQLTKKKTLSELEVEALRGLGLRLELIREKD
ncbi:MAG: hypothetical protein R3B54_13270 [Bdellovibrionota bacterium]